MILLLNLTLVLAPSQPPQQPKPFVPKLDPFLAELVKPDDRDTPLRKLQKERVKERATAVAHIEERIKMGSADDSTFSDLAELQKVLWANAVEVSTTPDGAVEAHKRRVRAMQSLESYVTHHVQLGRLAPYHQRLMRVAQIDAEIGLLKLPNAPTPEIDPLIAGILKLTDNAAWVRFLRQERLKEQALAVASLKAVIDIGTWDAKFFRAYGEVQRALWRNAAEFATDPADVVKCHEKWVEAAKQIEKFDRVRVETGNEAPHWSYAATALLADAEIELRRLKESKDRPAPKLTPAKEPALKIDPFLVELSKTDEKDTPLRKLQKERVKLRAWAMAEIKEVMDKVNWNPMSSRETVELQGALWRNAAELVANAADVLTCHEKRVETMKEWEKFVTDRVKSGRQLLHDLHLAKADRLDAEIELLNLKESRKGGK